MLNLYLVKFDEVGRFHMYMKYTLEHGSGSHPNRNSPEKNATEFYVRKLNWSIFCTTSLFHCTLKTLDSGSTVQNVLENFRKSSFHEWLHSGLTWDHYFSSRIELWFVALMSFLRPTRNSYRFTMCISLFALEFWGPQYSTWSELFLRGIIYAMCW